jgi:hypothetical protein
MLHSLQGQNQIGAHAAGQLSTTYQPRRLPCHDAVIGYLPYYYYPYHRPHRCLTPGRS